MRDPTWLQSLPVEAQRCFMKHALDLAQGLYQPEVRGALQGTTADKYNADKFHKATRVNQRFTAGFTIAYDTLIGPSSAASAGAADGEGGEKDDSASSKGAASAFPPEGIPEKTSRETDLAVFRTSCEKHCTKELDARLVALVAQGDHVEINADITSTRLYQNMTASVPCMAFYDVKNAKLCNVFCGEGK
jgi:hypothetical protein